ncbi:MAG TPA: leucyl/phenylalanyl-tRNA--protein transferase [Burkholderiaceae bacterium]|nr:leucyl/phenylalanyl-tRNA--protein transferase [Burkholderiaceae bacterium]
MPHPSAPPPLPWLLPSEPFPAVERAWGPDSPAPGLLAAGGCLDTPTLVQAYRQGIFPWYSDGQPILWWHTSPRMVLRTTDFHLSHSLRKLLCSQVRQNRLNVTFDLAFAQVIAACAQTPRPGQQGTWITDDMVQAYIDLHHAGVAHSVEVWSDDQLRGGLYALNVGRMVYGESMFARQSNASKVALAALVAFCRTHDLPAIDCQQVTSHLASLGAKPIEATAFGTLLHTLVDQPSPQWRFDTNFWPAVLGPLDL